MEEEMEIKAELETAGLVFVYIGASGDMFCEPRDRKSVV